MYWKETRASSGSFERLSGIFCLIAGGLCIRDASNVYVAIRQVYRNKKAAIVWQLLRLSSCILRKIETIEIHHFVHAAAKSCANFSFASSQA